MSKIELRITTVELRQRVESDVHGFANYLRANGIDPACEWVSMPCVKTGDTLVYGCGGCVNCVVAEIDAAKPILTPEPPKDVLPSKKKTSARRK